MSKFRLVFIHFLLNYFSFVEQLSSCEFSDVVDLQTAIFRSPYIFRVQPLTSKRFKEVRIRELIKYPLERNFSLTINEIVFIDFSDELCWQFFARSDLDLILFLNKTSHRRRFRLFYPPVEFEVRLRENLHDVLYQGRPIFSSISLIAIRHRSFQKGTSNISFMDF